MKKETLWTREFVLLCLSNLLMATSFYFLIATLPLYIQGVLKQDEETIGMVLASFTIAALVVRLFTGMALDRYSRKWIYLGAYLVLSLLFGGYAFAGSVAVLVMLRLMHGFSWGAVSTANATIIVDLIPEKRRGEGIGIFGLSMTLAMAIGPMFGLALADRAGWTVLFMSAMAVSIAGLALAFFVRYPARVIERKEEPFLFKNLIEEKAFPVSVLVIIVMVSYGGLISFVALYGREINIENPGIFFMLYAAGLAITRFGSGRIFDKKGPFLLMIFGLLILSVGFVVFALLKNELGFLVAGVLMGLGNGIFIPITQAMVNNMVPAERRGAVNSTLFTAFDIGIGMGMVLFGRLSGLTSNSFSYLIMAGIILAGLVVYLIWVHKHYEWHKLCSPDSPDKLAKAIAPENHPGGLKD